jgi:hypothetical protein
VLAALGLATLMWMTPQPAVETAPPVEADPAIYVVRDQDTTIFLFGTFHILSDDIEWFNGPVEQAFESSEELVVETLPVENAAATTAALPAPSTRMTPPASYLARPQHASPSRPATPRPGPPRPTAPAARRRQAAPPRAGPHREHRRALLLARRSEACTQHG